MAPCRQSPAWLEAWNRRPPTCPLRWMRWISSTPCVRLVIRTQNSLTRMSSITQRSEEHTSELQSQTNLVCRLLLATKTHLVGRWRTDEQAATAQTQRSGNGDRRRLYRPRPRPPPPHWIVGTNPTTPPAMPEVSAQG